MVVYNQVNWKKELWTKIMATGKKKIKYGTRKKKMKKIYETVLSLKTKYNLGQKTKYIK